MAAGLSWKKKRNKVKALLASLPLCTHARTHTQGPPSYHRLHHLKSQASNDTTTSSSEDYTSLPANYSAIERGGQPPRRSPPRTHRLFAGARASPETTPLLSSSSEVREREGFVVA